ncbi:DUF4136 domain-containing protein [Erythrobacter sp. THAF29]|uniref:DUF4136 domain-containing protein n=1 Tax=Erythrobacter sp. THAF29 TaxID=2587851 RepID=UPI0012693D0F|nr:DUF4136 domain-containing protein [Erythrobacter sp. THAF29]QFT78964.1 hypothetical protein FIU90_15555 [Erythrobacter sp. THAF29]
MTNPLIVSAKRLALPVLLAAGLSACAPSFNADVSRFTTTLPAPQGQSFAVVADDPKLAGGLEFSLYADMVADELEKLGYTEAASPSEATMLVRFDYHVDNGRERVRTTGSAFHDPYWGPWGRPYGFRRGYAFGFHDPFLAGPEVRSYTVYTSDIEVKIDSTTSGERLFEGNAQAVSRSNRLQTLVPNLVDALFTDFPGNSGETLRITIKDDGKSVRALR